MVGMPQGVQGGPKSDKPICYISNNSYKSDPIIFGIENRHLSFP